MQRDDTTTHWRLSTDLWVFSRQNDSVCHQEQVENVPMDYRGVAVTQTQAACHEDRGGHRDLIHRGRGRLPG